jgi:hypothetical protein
MKQFNLRKTNLLWWEPVETFTDEDLELLEHTFSIGFIPLGDEYGDHNPEWVKWKSEAKQEINKRLNSNKL